MSGQVRLRKQTIQWLVLKLDPSDKNSFEDVIETAQAVKEVFTFMKP